MAVNFCSNCGAKLRVGAKFCGSCGQKIQSQEEKLPPMPYEKSKSVMEVYAEKKTMIQTKATPAVNLEKDSSATNAKATATDTTPQKPVAKTIAEIYAEAKANSQAQVAPKQPQSQRSTSTPVQDSLSHYKEDVTIKEKFFSTEGRLNRWRYFTRSIWLLVPSVILIFMFLGSSSNGQTHSNASTSLIAVLIVYELIGIVPGVMLGIRRLHDLNLSGWFWLIFLVPYVNIVFGLYMIFAPGTVGSNKYGPDPLA